jgi:hypothetical protein
MRVTVRVVYGKYFGSRLSLSDFSSRLFESIEANAAEGSWEHPPHIPKARRTKRVIPGIPRQVYDGCAAVTLR